MARATGTDAQTSVLQLPGNDDFAVVITLTTDHCVKHFNSSEKRTFIIKYLRTVFGTIGAGLAAWYLTEDQLTFMATGVCRTDVNRIVYNFIFYTNELARRRFGHQLWRTRFCHEYCQGGLYLHQRLNNLDQLWRQDALQHYSILNSESNTRAGAPLSIKHLGAHRPA